MAFGAYAPLPIRLRQHQQESVSASQHARICADLVAVKRVAPLARWYYNQTGTLTGTMLSYSGMNGSGLAYAPTAVASADGVVTFTYSSPQFEDEYEVQAAFKIKHAIANVLSTSGVARWAQVLPVANGVKVTTWNHTGSSGGQQLICVTVW